MNDYEQLRHILLDIGEALMSIGTKRNMSEDWYSMIMKYVEHGISICYRHQADKQKPCHSCNIYANDYGTNFCGNCGLPLN